MPTITNGTESAYNGSITREQFLFYETRIVARLMIDEEKIDQEIIDQVKINWFRCQGQLFDS